MHKKRSLLLCLACPTSCLGLVSTLAFRQATGATRCCRRLASDPGREALESFFEDANRAGRAAVREMSIEERTRLAIIGEELEDEIMSKATALRDLADSMVEQTGAVDEKQLRPLIDEIGELKTQYRAVLGGVVRSNAP